MRLPRPSRPPRRVSLSLLSLPSCLALCLALAPGAGAAQASQPASAPAAPGASAPAAQAPGALRLHGVSVPPSAQVGSTRLRLNGAGTRYFLIFKVYVAELYLPRPAHSASAALGMPGPKLMRLVMLRDVSGKELGDKLTEDIKNNVPAADFATMITGLARMGGLFADRHELHEGDVVELADVPGQGMRISINGQVEGAPYADAHFFDNLLRVWLGPRPAAQGLKKALLGDFDESK
jgi:Chalcone isomerase-like